MANPVINNSSTPVTPCFISIDESRFFNMFSMAPTNFAHNGLVDISRPVQNGNSWLYVGNKSEEYSINCSAFFSDTATRHAYKIFLANSTGIMYDIYDYFGNITYNQLFRQVRYTNEQIYLNYNDGQYCYPNLCKLEFDLSIIPQ